jgi:hypothetical protein
LGSREEFCKLEKREPEKFSGLGSEQGEKLRFTNEFDDFS